MATIRAPFTKEQCDALNLWQHSEWVHPFTCGNDSNHRELVATPAGWQCLDCDYTQDWAHGVMLQPPIDFVAEMAKKAWREHLNGPGSPFDLVAS